MRRQSGVIWSQFLCIFEIVKLLIILSKISFSIENTVAFYELPDIVKLIGTADENLKEINAVHLFVVSGFHISFIYSIINKLIKTKKIISNIISLLICCFYVYLLNFSISALRAVLTIGISTFFKDKLNALDSLSISGILILLIEPLNVFNYSFIMSFLLTFTIIICNKILKRYNKVFQMLLISLVCFLVMFPIQLSLNYEVNFLLKSDSGRLRHICKQPHRSLMKDQASPTPV